MGTCTELGEKVVVFYDGGKGTTVHLAEALIPESSSLKRVVCQFPWKDSEIGGASSEIIHFKDYTGVTQEVPCTTCAYVIHELFDYLLTSAPIRSPGFNLIVPAISRVSGSALNYDIKNNNVKIYTAFLNGASGLTIDTVGCLPKLPSTFRLQDGFLAYLIHYAHATGLPTVLLLGPYNQVVGGDKEEGFEVLHALGDIIALEVGLTCSRQKIKDMANVSSLIGGVEDDWRRLYI